jgi:HlyD family secretion protein
MDGRLADADAPDLGIRVTGKEALGSLQGFVGHLELAGVHVDGHDLPRIGRFHARAYLSLVDFGASSGMLFFVVARLASCHGVLPIYRKLHKAAALIVGHAALVQFPGRTRPLHPLLRQAMILKYFLPLLALAALAFAVYHVVHTRPLATTAAPPLPPPQAPFAESLAASGVVEACSGNVAVAAPAPGVVAEVFVHVGQEVSAGAPLFCLDDRPLQGQLRVQEARLATARAQLRRLEEMPRDEELKAAAARVGEAQANLKAQEARLVQGRSLGAKGLASAQEVEQLQQAVVAAKEQVARAQAEDRQLRAGAWEADRAVARAAVAEAGTLVEQVKSELKRLTVDAPLAATVLQVNVRTGEAVAERAERSPVVLGDVRRLHLRVDIEEHHVADFRSTAPARALPRGRPEPSFPLRFVRVEPLLVPKRVLRGDGGERSDTRVLQVLYEFDPEKAPVYVGEQMDVFISLDAAHASAKRR